MRLLRINPGRLATNLISIHVLDVFIILTKTGINDKELALSLHFTLLFRGQQFLEASFKVAQLPNDFNYVDMFLHSVTGFLNAFFMQSLTFVPPSLATNKMFDKKLF